MTTTLSHHRFIHTFVRFAAVLSTAVALGACAGGQGPSLDLGLSDDAPPKLAQGDRNDMGKALNYWGQRYAKKPADKEAALNYAKNLKAAGHKKQAFAVLQQASVLHGNDREIASEYGRLALEHNQVQLANKLLALADDRSSPDWRIVSGRGAALAKMGRYGEAVAMFERAHLLAPSNPSVMNNLAMAHAGNGDLQQAEMLLRKASENPMARAKVAKNLALVQNLQRGRATSDIQKKLRAARSKQATSTSRSARRQVARSRPTAPAKIRRSVKPSATTKGHAPLASVVRTTLQ